MVEQELLFNNKNKYKISTPVSEILTDRNYYYLIYDTHDYLLSLLMDVYDNIVNILQSIVHFTRSFITTRMESAKITSRDT